jgi:SanA protein
MLLVLLVLGSVAVGLPLALRWWTDYRYASRIYTIEGAPTRRVGLVFGAGYWADGVLSPVLADRVDAAVDLYRSGKVEKLLMSGDNRTLHYNEPAQMREYALSRGVPDVDIVLDFAGRRTYDSCYRARHIFCLSEVTLVTQSYHLDRALFTANALGIDAIGVKADRREYRHIRYYWWRELLATGLAWWQVVVSRPTPVMGDPLPIFPGACDGH